MLASAFILGVLLLLTVPAAIVRAGDFTYQNPGETAYVSATNNDPNTIFTVTAMQNTTVIGAATTPPEPMVVNIGGGHLLPGSHGGTEIFYPAMFYGTVPTVANLPSSYGYTSYENLLLGMHSSYALLGTGNGDQFILKGGITDDTWSVTGPGVDDSVAITTGSGTYCPTLTSTAYGITSECPGYVGFTTYNINIGPQGSVTINAAGTPAHYSIGSTNSVYNIIF